MTCSAPTPESIFACRQCGECCRGYGGTYVTAADAAGISEYLGIDPNRFQSDFCEMSGRRLVLRQAANGYCVFYRNGLCGIHPVKPRMCRRWPFIESVLTDVRNWYAMATCCPGMRDDVSEADVVACVSAVLSREDANG